MNYTRPLTHLERKLQEFRYQLHEFCVVLYNSPGFVLALCFATLSLMCFGQAWGLR